MADDASLERFLAGAAALKACSRLNLLQMFELLSAMRDDDDGTLTEQLQVAMEVSLAAAAAPEPRSAAFASYAFERITIDIENRLRSVEPRPLAGHSAVGG